MSSHPLIEPLKRLRLSGILETFETRVSQARENGLSHTEWLGLLLQDEIQRREAQMLTQRFKYAKFEQQKTFEEFKLERYPLPTQYLIRDLMCGHYLREHQHVLIVGPAGTGKTHLSQALGHQACRQGQKVRFIRTSALLRELHAGRADHSWEKVLNRYVTPDLLILDDFGLTSLTISQAEDIYELIADRYIKASIILTSNRKIEAWSALFPDPAMGSAAVDRLKNGSHHILLEGESYRTNLRPKPSEKDKVNN